MYKLKSQPEDFIVREIPSITIKSSGTYAYFVLKKRNYTTLRAIEHIAHKLNVPPKHIGFAGNKDKIAVTEQTISIKAGKKEYESIALQDISLTFVGFGEKEQFIGNLKGNEFIITLRNLNDTLIKKIIYNMGHKKILNFYGEQRFSKFNVRIGLHLLKKQYRDAIELICQTNSDYKGKILLVLKEKPNDVVGALNTIPKNLLQIYVHAVQSYFFNEMLSKIIEQGKNIPAYLPMVGFGTDAAKTLLEPLLKKEKLNYRDFINKQIPALSLEGEQRKTHMAIKKLKISAEKEDDLNTGKQIIILKFLLPKGCYATEVVRQLCE